MATHHQRKYKKIQIDPINGTVRSSSHGSDNNGNDENLDKSDEVLIALKTGIEDASNAIAGVFAKTGEKLKEATKNSNRKLDSSDHSFKSLSKVISRNKSSERIHSSAKQEKEARAPSDDEAVVTSNKNTAHFADDYVIVKESGERPDTDNVTKEKDASPALASARSIMAKRDNKEAKMGAGMPNAPPMSLVGAGGLATLGVTITSIHQSTITPLISSLTSYQIFMMTIIASSWMAFAFWLGQWNATDVLTKIVAAVQNQNKDMKQRITELEKEVAQANAASAGRRVRTSTESRADFLRSQVSMIGKVGASSTGAELAPAEDRDHGENKDQLLPEGFFTSLQDQLGDEPPQICDFLCKRLLKIDNLTRHPKNDQQIMPLCTWRGIDFLLTDSPEEPIYRNRYLNR
jgi:hypothetical protein